MTLQATARIAPWLGRTSLKTRVTVLTLVLFVSTIWLLTFHAVEDLHRDFQGEIATQQSMMVRYIGASIENEIATRNKALSTIAARIAPEWLSDRKAMAGFLEQRLTIQGLFNLGLFTIGRDGTGIADFPVFDGRASARYDQLEYFKEVMATGQPAIGRPRIGRFAKEPVVVMAVPIKDKTGAVTGVLAGANPIAGTAIFHNVHRNTGTSEMGIHVISRRDRLIVTSTDQSLVLQPAPAPGSDVQLDRYMNGDLGSGIAVSSRGIEETSSAVTIAGTDWFVVATQPTRVAYSRIADTERHLYGEAAVLSLAMTMLIWLFVHREMAPLDRYAAALRRMTTGEVPLQTVPVEGGKEIRQLTASFNDLCVRLRSQEAILQESETRFRLLADTVPVLIWLADDRNQYYYFNKVWLDFTGRSLEQESDNGWTAGIHPDDLQSCLDTYLKGFKARQSFSTEVRLRRHDGEYRWLYDHGAPRYDTAGTFIGFVGGCLDITDRKLAEERLIEARHVAEAASRAKSAFLAMMSHELRTPMTGVIGMADFLSETPLNENQQLYIETMRSSARTLLGVLNDILDYSKIDSDRLTLSFETFDATTLAADTVRLFEPKAEENGSLITLDLGGLSNLVVTGDPTRVKQVLGNLISNAAKFTRDGKILVRLRHQDEDPGVRLIFEVEDTGIGISATDMARLFQPFSQSDEGATRKFGGTGLGLAISKRLVELMGGEITASSQLGRGAVFRFTCAVERGRLEDLVAAPTESVSVPPMSILLAEDNVINRMIVKIGLEHRRHRVTVAENGVQAYEAAASGQFDVILMDMQMPVMDGTEATRRIRSLPPPMSAVPIVALTADALAEHRQAYMDTGLTDFLTKPVIWTEVDAVLARLRSGITKRPTKVTDVDALEAAGDQIQLVDRRRLIEIRTIMMPPDYSEMIRELVTCGRDELTLLRAAISQKDITLVHRIAHGIKGMFLNIGGVRVAALAKQLQTCTDIEAAETLFRTTAAAVQDTAQALERFSSDGIA